jgi:GNAT superfamily N-acetyltransferase
MTEAQNRLDLREVVWEMVARWVREGGAASPGARLELYPDRVPDDMLEEVCPVLTDLLNLMPFEDKDHGKIVQTPDLTREHYARLDAAGASNHFALIREADGSISGMTDVLRFPHEAGLVRQEFTGVYPRARGRGLGKWLKAAMLEYVRQTHPDTVYVTTENAGSNAAMLAINHQLGFRRHRTATFYQVGRQALGRLRSS